MAGRIPQNFIDDLLDRVDIVDVIDRRVTLKKTGKNFSACCPFHNEKTPSFSVNPDKQFYYCFGCGAGGNSIGFLMDYENLDFPAAVEALAASAGLEVPREQSSGPGREQSSAKSQGLYEVLQWASVHYQTQLRRHANRDQAVNYLKQRGLSGEVARDFAIGFAPSGWDGLLKAAAQSEHSANINEKLEACGMLVKKENGDYYDRFRERIMFPIRDNRGRVIAFGGRVLGDEKPKYLNSPETAVFHKQRELYGLYEARQANRQLEYILLVEGYMDVVALVQHGITNAVATLGTASSIFHLEKIFRHSSKLVVCFDGDEAGHKAAERLLETALPAMRDGREICFLFLPDGEDPDSYVREKGKTAFEQCVQQAQPLEQFLFASTAENIDLSSEAGKAKFSQRCLPLIEKIPEGVYKQLLLNLLADKTGAKIEWLEREASKLPSADRDSSRPSSSPGSKASAQSASQSQHQQPGGQPAANAEPEPPAFAQAHQRDADNREQLGEQRTPVVWAIAILLHYPELGREITELPVALADVKSQETQLLGNLHSHIRSLTTAVNTYTLLGHWHGTSEADALHNCANHHNPPDTIEIARQELLDTLQTLERQLEDEKLDSFVSGLKGTSPDQLTDADRRRLAGIGSSKRKPVP